MTGPAMTGAGAGTGAGTGAGLSARVRALLADAAAAYLGRPGYQRLASVNSHLDQPLRVAITGRVKAGKSTLLNALVGRRVAATDAGECTQVVTWYAYGDPPVAWAYPRSGPRRALMLIEGDAAGVLDLGNLRAADLEQLRVDLPNGWLSRMTLIDTPGMGSLSERVARRAQEFLAADGEDTGEVDAVLYLLRHLHSSDVDFLEVLHETRDGTASPINAVGVLSRADEVGGGGPDAVDHAQRIASGYRQDPRIRSLLHTVIPVAGLLAETASTLSDQEFADLITLAGASASATAPMLLSVARFVAPFRSVDLPGANRQRLLRRLGLYGVRMSLDAIREAGGSMGRQQLGDLLRERSGLADLRRLLLTQFAERRDVIKAESALRVIETVTRTDPIPAARQLREQVERLRTNAHELAEIRLLTELRTGQVPAPADEVAEMERLLGGDGTATTTRLGLAADATAADIAAAIADQHDRWRRVGANRFTEPALARAAGVLQRTCEGLAAAANLTAQRG
jgi:50S ribosome-binding GTPase